MQVYCEFCGRYVKVDDGDQLLLCPGCGAPLMFLPLMDLGVHDG